ADVAHTRRAVRARQRDHAAERVIPTGELFGGGFEQPRESSFRVNRRVMEDGIKPLARPLQIRARGFAVERFLAAERVVEARSPDTHRRYQVVERRALITALPEQLHRRLQRNGTVEHRRPSPAAFPFSLRLTFLPCNYFWCHRSKNP